MSLSEEITVVFSADTNFVPYFAVALRSLMEHVNPQRRYQVLLLTDATTMPLEEQVRGMLKESPNIRLRFIDMSKYAHLLKDFHVEDRFSYAAYYRLFIAEVCPELSRVIYLDCDVLIHSDLCALADLDMGNALVAATKDLPISQLSSTWLDEARAYIKSLGMEDPAMCFNSGVLLMNLEAIRRENLQPRFCEIASRNKKYWHDQTVLNIACQGRVCFLGEEWNHSLHMYQESRLSVESIELQRRIAAERSFRIIHFATGGKPWKNLLSPYALLWWQAASRTPFFGQIRAKGQACVPSWPGRSFYLQLLRMALALLLHPRNSDRRRALLNRCARLSYISESQEMWQKLLALRQ